MKKEYEYSIGEICQICGITRSMLRYYDEIGLVKPHRVDDATGYRYYTKEVLIELPILHYLKSLGFSLKEIKNILASNDLNILENLFAEKVFQWEKEAGVLEMKINSIVSWMDLIRETREVFALPEVTVGLRYIPQMPMTFFHCSDFPGRSYENLLVNTTICQNVLASDVYTTGALYLYYPDGNRQNWDDLSVCIANQVDASRIDEQRKIGGYSAITCYHRGDFDSIDETVAKMKAWAEEHYFVLRGDLLERSVIDCWSVKNKDWWLMEIFLPIVEK